MSKLSASSMSASSSSNASRGSLRGNRRGNSRSGRSSRTFNQNAGRPSIPVSLTPLLQASLTGEASFTTSTSVPTYVAYSFAVSGGAGSSEYLGLFDQYRIDAVECWLEPFAAQGTTVFSEVVSAIDLDDANTPTTVAQVQARQDSLCTGGGAGHYHVWTPHAAIATYSGVFTSFANVVKPWIDSGSPNVQHYGLKIACAVTPAVISYHLTFRLHCSFRAPGL